MAEDVGYVIGNAIERLLEDKHRVVKWGERIPGVESLIKAGSPFGDSNIWGELSVTFIDPIEVSLLESLLKDGEELELGDKGTLTSKGYTPDEYYVYRKQEKGGSVTQTLLLKVKWKELSAYIYGTYGDLRMDPRAVEILKTYLESINRNKIWIRV